MNCWMLWKKDQGLVYTSTFKLGLSFDVFCKIGRGCAELEKSGCLVAITTKKYVWRPDHGRGGQFGD